jgi:hypothetical protein
MSLVLLLPLAALGCESVRTTTISVRFVTVTPALTETHLTLKMER